MTDKFRDNRKEDKSQIDISTEYIGNEETEYIHTAATEYENIEETEYQEPGKNKASESNIINQRYKIVETLGKGGMGSVYKALDIRLRNTPVAIKEISLETIENERIERVIENFENEAETLIQLRHNSIPRVMDFFSLDNDKCYIVMDLIEGETLAQVVKRRGKIPEKEVREWLDQLSDVLNYLHNREPKIIFRDLKPSNVMLTKDNEIKLIDFGIARTFKDDKNSDTSYYVSQGFSPPEQYGTGQSDERSDIYSLGALLYSLLIGGKPKIKDFKFESLKNYIDISDELDNAIMLATDFRPENRPSSVAKFIDLLNSPNKVVEDTNNNYVVNDNKLDIGGKDNKNDKANKNKFKKNIIVFGLAVIVLVFGVYRISNLTNIGTENVKSIKEPIDEEVVRAMDELYTVTNADKDSVKYEYSQKDNYVLEDYMKDKYYVFKAHNIDEKGNIVSTELYNYVVNKQTFSVWVYFAGGQLMAVSDGYFPSIEEKYKKYYYELNPNIKKAFDSIIKTIGIDETVKYEYDPESEEYSNLNNEYYIFSDYGLDYNGEIAYEGDTSIAVHKKTLEVYTYTPSADYESMLIKYNEEGTNEDKSVDTSMYDYTESGEDWLDECKRIHGIYGWDLCQDSEAHSFLRRDLSSSATSGTPGNTGDIESLGYDWYLECIDIHNGDCETLDDHRMLNSNSSQSNSHDYDMTKLYEFGAEYDFSKSTIDEIFNDGFNKGYNYAKNNPNASNEEIEEYIYINSPENVSLSFWEPGFWDGYNKFKKS